MSELKSNNAYESVNFFYNRFNKSKIKALLFRTLKDIWSDIILSDKFDKLLMNIKKLNEPIRSQTGYVLIDIIRQYNCPFCQHVENILDINRNLIGSINYNNNNIIKIILEILNSETNTISEYILKNKIDEINTNVYTKYEYRWEDDFNEESEIQDEDKIINTWKNFSYLAYQTKSINTNVISNIIDDIRNNNNYNIGNLNKYNELMEDRLKERYLCYTCIVNNPDIDINEIIDKRYTNIITINEGFAINNTQFKTAKFNNNIFLSMNENLREFVKNNNILLTKWQEYTIFGSLQLIQQEIYGFYVYSYINVKLPNLISSRKFKNNIRLGKIELDRLDLNEL